MDLHDYGTWVVLREEHPHPKAKHFIPYEDFTVEVLETFMNVNANVVIRVVSNGKPLTRIEHISEIIETFAGVHYYYAKSNRQVAYANT